jgi:transposase-like protein
MQLLLAVGIDANGNNIILAWALVESENRVSWEYFLRLLRTAIPEVTNEGCVFISDREKGLMEADELLGQRIARAICCKHLQENLIYKYGGALKSLFWSLARAKTEHIFDKVLGKIREVKPQAAAYF